MCNGLCVYRFKKKSNENHYYCQRCAIFVPYSELYKEMKTNGRLRCSCCNCLVRNKPRTYKVCSAQAV